MIRRSNATDMDRHKERLSIARVIAVECNVFSWTVGIGLSSEEMRKPRNMVQKVVRHCDKRSDDK
jgi:hypothetical protein